MQITLNLLIDPFILPITLQMIRSTHFQLIASSRHKSLPERAGKYRISVRDNKLGHAVKLVDIIQEKFRYFVSCEWVFQRNKVIIFCKLINNH